MATEYEWKKQKDGTMVLTAKKETDKKKINRLEIENKKLKIEKEILEHKVKFLEWIIELNKQLQEMGK